MNSSLTGEALRAQPPGDYMSQEQLEFFKQLLVEERAALLSLAQETATHLQDGGATPDPSDRATQEEEDSLELRVRDRERKHLHTIDEALARISDGRFGWCEETGEAIGIPRLLARPTAVYSLDAQARHEHQRRMAGR